MIQATSSPSVRVRVGVGRTRDRHHRRELRVAERREPAGDRREQERERRRPGRRPRGPRRPPPPCRRSRRCPAPMMAPTPSAVSCTGPSARFSWPACRSRPRRSCGRATSPGRVGTQASFAVSSRQAPSRQPIQRVVRRHAPCRGPDRRPRRRGPPPARTRSACPVGVRPGRPRSLRPAPRPRAARRRRRTPAPAAGRSPRHSVLDLAAGIDPVDRVVRRRSSGPSRRGSRRGPSPGETPRRSAAAWQTRPRSRRGAHPEHRAAAIADEQRAVGAEREAARDAEVRGERLWRCRPASTR